MLSSHFTGLGKGPGTGQGSMGSNILCRSVHTCLRQGQGPGPIVSYYVSSLPCTIPGSGPVQYE